MLSARPALAPAPPTSKWAAAAALDPQAELSRFTQQRMGGGGVYGASGGDAGPKKAAPPSAPLSLAQKKLAQTNVKGMKSMASFFAPKPPA